MGLRMGQVEGQTPTGFLIWLFEDFIGYSRLLAVSLAKCESPDLRSSLDHLHVLSLVCRDPGPQDN